MSVSRTRTRDEVLEDVVRVNAVDSYLLRRRRIVLLLILVVVVALAVWGWWG